MSLPIQMQNTPNPNAVKIILEKDVITDERKVTFTSKAECPNVPLASGLFDVPSVVQIHFFQNVITVTKDDSRDWTEVAPEMEEVVSNLMGLHNPDFELAPEKTSRSTTDMSPELQEINSILDRTIRPGLQSDGGDMEIIEFRDNNELLIRYEGACGSCPSSTAGTLYAIEGILRDEYHPEIKVIME